MTTDRTSKRPGAPAVTMLEPPTARSGLCPEGAAGLVEIGGDLYWMRLVEHDGHVLGYELEKMTTGAIYAVPHDLSTCECLGFLAHGRCKHRRAIALCRQGGKLA